MKAKIESMEECSEDKTKKNKPELRNSNENADYLYSSSKIIESVFSHTMFVYDKPGLNWHASAASLEYYK